jgi:hypothetical protein
MFIIQTHFHCQALQHTTTKLHTRAQALRRISESNAYYNYAFENLKCGNNDVTSPSSAGGGGGDGGSEELAAAEKTKERLDGEGRERGRGTDDVLGLYRPGTG